MPLQRGSTAKTPTPAAASAKDAGAIPPPPPDFILAGVIGSQLSEPLAAIGKVIDDFVRTRGITAGQITQLRSCLSIARTVAKQSQQISRLAGGRLRQSHERLKLDELIRDALAERGPSFKVLGVELYHNLSPVEVIVDPGLLSSLIDAAIDWALVMGRRLVVTLEMKNWPEHGMFFIKASDSIGTGSLLEGQAEGDNLGWFLLSEIARAMGVSVNRVMNAQESSLMLEFPRTVKQLEGLTAVEVETGGDSMNSDSRPMAGHRLLVITGDDKLSAEIKMIARSLSLVVDFVPTTWQGVRFCELDTPHMVIIDERVRDHIFDELRADLKRTDPNYPFVEIATESNTLEIAGWMSDSITRLSRDALRSQLPSILTLELAKIM